MLGVVCERRRSGNDDSWSSRALANSRMGAAWGGAAQGQPYFPGSDGGLSQGPNAASAGAPCRAACRPQPRDSGCPEARGATQERSNEPWPSVMAYSSRSRSTSLDE